MSPEVIGTLPPLERAKVLYNVDLNQPGAVILKVRDLGMARKYDEVDRLTAMYEEHQANERTLEKLSELGKEERLEEAA